LLIYFLKKTELLPLPPPAPNLEKKPTTGIEPVNLILTKDVLYRLSYMGAF
jgi:hypothetical protein